MYLEYDECYQSYTPYSIQTNFCGVHMSHSLPLFSRFLFPSPPSLPIRPLSLRLQSTLPCSIPCSSSRRRETVLGAEVGGREEDAEGAAAGGHEEDADGAAG
jgi:hypothetical protein